MTGTGIVQEKNMHITIQTAPPDLIRNKQVGDWRISKYSLAVLVSLAIPNEASQLAVGIHELIEAFLCRANNITDGEVCTFDEQFEAGREEGLHRQDEEPGDDPNCPYWEEHQAATFVERAVCAAIGLPWSTHSQVVSESGELPPKNESPVSPQP